jgi:type VI secretion system secreted protein Hcp
VAADYFLKLDPKVEGESTDSKHKGEIELETFSYSIMNPTSSLQGGGGAGAGKSMPGDVVFTKKIDKSSPRLAQAVAQGDHFKGAIVTIRKSGGTQQEYLTLTLNDCYISSYSTSGSGNGVPMESFSMNYAKMVSEYKEQKADGSLGGSVKLGYDWAKQVKV